VLQDQNSSFFIWPFYTGSVLFNRYLTMRKEQQQINCDLRTDKNVQHVVQDLEWNSRKRGEWYRQWRRGL